MKNNNKIWGLLGSAAMMLSLAACTEEVDYTPAEPYTDDSYGVYFPAQSDEYKASGSTNTIYSKAFDPADPTEMVFAVKRNKTAGAITVPMTVKGDDVFVVEPISFADGADSTSFKVTFPTAEVGKTYTGMIEVSDPEYVGTYSDKVTYLRFSAVRERWESLGYGQFSDTYWFEDNPYEVEVLRNTSDTTRFRLVKPYDEGANTDDDGWFIENGYYDDSVIDEYFSFRLLQKGETINGVSVSEDHLLYFDEYETGLIHPSYNMLITLIHPCYFSSGVLTNNRVLNYKSDGTPGVVQFAPFYYMYEYPGGFNYSTYEDMITFRFPGAADYAFGLEVGEPADGKIQISTTDWGTDIAIAKIAYAEGVLTEAAIESLADDIAKDKVEAAATIEGPGTVTASFEETGYYTAVFALFDKEGTLVGSDGISFGYVAADDDQPVVADIMPAYTTKESATFFFHGEKLTDAIYRAYETDKLAGLDTDKIVDDIKTYGTHFTAAELAQANAAGAGITVKGLNEGTDYTIVVWAFNGYVSELFATEVLTLGQRHPLKTNWSADDIYEIEKEELFKTWTLYGYSYFDETPNRVEMFDVTFAESDETDEYDSDLIEVTGLTGGMVENDTVLWEYYAGYVLNIDNGMFSEPDAVYGAYYISLPLFTSSLGGSLSGNWGLFGGLVEDGYMFFADNDTSYGIDGYCIRANDANGNSAGNFDIIYDIVLQDPAVADAAAVASAKKAAMKDLKQLNESFMNRTNYVETNRSYMRSKIDALRAAKRAKAAVKTTIAAKYSRNGAIAVPAAQEVSITGAKSNFRKEEMQPERAEMR